MSPNVPSRRQAKVALVGNPNVGKSTIFNALTRGNAWIGNWPGTTVEKKIGKVVIEDYELEIVDLPGIYSLSAYTIDERIAIEYIIEEKPDLVVVIVNAANIERSLYLALSILEANVKAIIVLNMIDIAESQGLKIDHEKLMEILKVPVVPTIANRGRGIEELKKMIIKSLGAHQTSFKPLYDDAIEQTISKLISEMSNDEPLASSFDLRWLAIKLLEGDDYITNKVKSSSPALLKVVGELKNELEASLDKPLDEIFVEKRHELAHKISALTSIKQQTKQLTWTDIADFVITHKVFGIPIMLTVVYFMFKFAFEVAEPLCTLVDYAFSSYLPSLVSLAGMPEILTSLINDGILAGIGSVLIFLPNIVFLFLFISMLEDLGYLARAAFVVDKLMQKFKLTGKSLIPLFLGWGCNIPAVIATRAIDDENDRKTTALVAPLMSCAARLPVYLIFAGAFFSAYQGSIVLSMYIIGLIMTLLIAAVFRRTLFKGFSSGFVIELPPYMAPQLKSLSLKTWFRAKNFLRKAGTIIIMLVIIVWALSVTGPTGYLGVNALEDPTLAEKSWIGLIGHGLEIAFKPMGWDWRASSALLIGFVAKEAVVSSMGVLYGVSEEGLTNAIARHFTPLSAYAYMLFVLIYVPCIATIAAIRSELGSKYAILALAYELALAYAIALIVTFVGHLAGLT
ncbi:MAG: ferrous iron transport protein B [Candidatus Nezhaarchaeales archaeon]